MPWAHEVQDLSKNARTGNWDLKLFLGLGLICMLGYGTKLHFQLSAGLGAAESLIPSPQTSLRIAILSLDCGLGTRLDC